MIRVEAQVPGRGVVRVLSSFLVPFARNPDGDRLAVAALDLLGNRRAVEGVCGLLSSGGQVLAVVGGQEVQVSVYGSGARARRVKVGDWTHALLAAPVFWQLVEEGGVLWGEGSDEQLLGYLKSRTALPVLREWLPELPRVLRESLREYRVLGEPPAPLRVVRLVEDPERELRAALRAGRLRGPGSGSVSERLARVGSLEDYLREFAPELARKVAELAQPLRRPGDPDDPRLGDLVRRPFRAQAEAIQGLVAAARRGMRALVLNGDMGTGKTFVACAASWLLHPSGRYRVLVMCPAHLVPKWGREIEATVPGARANVLRSWREAACLPRSEPRRPEFYVLSKEVAKLSWFWRPGAVWRRNRYECPRCGQVLSLQRDAFRERRAENARCGRCGEVLWQADRDGVRRVAVCDVVKRLPRGYFDLFIADEAHMYKSASSAQGRAFGVFAARARRVLALTGTITGGYASDLFYLLYRLDPSAMKAAGYGYGDVGKFVAAYGCLEKVYGAGGSGRAARSSRGGAQARLKEKPGVSPAVFSEHLLERTVFLELSDLACDLPPYREEVMLVDMAPEQRRAYEALRAGLRGDVARALRSGSGRVAGFVHAALSYPDRPSGNPPVSGPGQRVLAVPQDLPEWGVYPKEEALVELCREEVARGRRVFVYVAYTGTRDVSGRLQEILSAAGLRVAVLRESVRPDAREEWIARQVRDGVEVVVANARLVEVGLDLIDFPVLVWYQSGYSLYTVRQASRRSWRIGQTQPVRVVFMANRAHLQEAVLRLMGTKLRAALALEGRFSAEGLRAMAQGDDLGVELARVLVEGLERVEGLELFGSSVAPPRPALRLVAAGGGQLAWEF